VTPSPCVFATGESSDDSNAAATPMIGWVIVCLATAALAGTAGVATCGMRMHRAYRAELAQRVVQLEEEHDVALERAAAAAEQARIAHDLHDVVAHRVSAIVIQADGAQFALDADPQQARTALEAIAAIGRQTLGEMRELRTRSLRRALD
jgi:signal transduction histidine kinase